MPDRSASTNRQPRRRVNSKRFVPAGVDSQRVGKHHKVCARAGEMRSRSRPSPLLLLLLPCPHLPGLLPLLSGEGRKRDGEMAGDPAAPITPSQIGIPLLISQRKKKKECLSSASRHQSCAAGSTTAAMLLRNMQSDGTAQVLAVCTIRHTTRERKARAAPGAGCRLQIAGYSQVHGTFVPRGL